MFDFDLQVRFWRGISDAMLHGTQASLAAASAIQDEILKQSDTAGPARSSRIAPTRAAAEVPAALWWLGPWQAMVSATGSSASPICAPNSGAAAANPFGWMTAWSNLPWMQMVWREAVSANTTNSVMQPVDLWKMWGISPANAFAGPFAAFWPWSALRWDQWQAPMTAMFMSAGMPFAVAAPSAKASTAALDAAHAAREQLDKMYSTYRSDGGHAAAQIAALPWAFATSLLDNTNARTGNRRVA